MVCRHVIWAGRAFSASALLLIAVGWPAQAQDFFPAPRDFVIDKSCNATRSIRSQADPVPLDVGKNYAARGVNRSGNPTHAFIRVEDADKWVDLSCGHFADGAAPAPGNVSDSRPGADRQCLPFFDTVDNPEKLPGGPADITPPPAALDDLDRAINAACGAPGKVVSEDEFKAMLRARPDVLERIKAFTGGQVYANRPAAASVDDYLTDLTDAWFKIKAFDHIFCGEIEGRSIGGLHFAGRYLQLQDSGEACRMNNFRQNEVEPGVIYTMGVRMKTTGDRFAQHSTKGYGLTMNGEDILKIATRAFRENPTTSTESKGCLLSVADDGKQFKTVFVRRQAGIRTFYPDATPNGPGDRRNEPCRDVITTED
jgi:hypothetical protein